MRRQGMGARPHPPALARTGGCSFFPADLGYPGAKLEPTATGGDVDSNADTEPNEYILLLLLRQERGPSSQDDLRASHFHLRRMRPEVRRDPS